MSEKKFEWLGPRDQFTAEGLKLEVGKTYNAAAFGEAVVDEWARTGNARILPAGKKKAGAQAGGEEA